MKHNALRTVEPCALFPFLPVKHSEIPIRYPDGKLAFRALASQVWTLARMGMVQGRVYKDQIAYAILLAPLSAAMRVLRTDPPRQFEVSKRRQDKGSLYWMERPDRAKGGTVGRSKARVRPDTFAKRVEAVPGLRDATGKPVVAERRIVDVRRQQFKAIICSGEML